MESTIDGGTSALLHALTIEQRNLSSLKLNPRNARTHSKKQVQAIAESIREFGFTNPILIDDNDMVLAGHGRVSAGEPLSQPARTHRRLQSGDDQHTNNVELGRFGRNRTNVWHYAGVNSFKRGRREELDVHPTVKPVALVVDAIKDVTRRGDVVLDLFGGSGTTLVAAERTARKARLLEIEPVYVDVTIRRFERITKADAVWAR